MHPRSGAAAGLKRPTDEASALQAQLAWERQRVDKRKRMQHILRPGMAPMFMGDGEEEATLPPQPSDPHSAHQAHVHLTPSIPDRRRSAEHVPAPAVGVAIDLQALQAPGDDDDDNRGAAAAVAPLAAPNDDAGDAPGAGAVEDRRAAIRRRVQEREAERARADEEAARVAAEKARVQADVASSASDDSDDGDEVDNSDPLLASLRTQGLGSRPVYVPRSQRATLAVRDAVKAAADAEIVHEVTRAQERKAESTARAAAAIEAEEDAVAAERARAAEGGPVVNMPYPDDSDPSAGDELNAERALWEARELARVRRDVLERLLAEQQVEALEKRRLLTAEERAEIGRAREQQMRQERAHAGYRSGGGSSHTGAGVFFTDEATMSAEDKALFARDVSDPQAATARRPRAPGSGLKGQHKKQTLAEQDTSANDPWARSQRYNHGRGASNGSGFGGGARRYDTLELPRAKRAGAGAAADVDVAAEE